MTCWNSLAPFGRPVGAVSLLLALAIVAVFPFYWLVIGSVMPPVELFASVPRLWPSEFDFSTYRRIFELVPLGRYFANSVVVSGVTTVIAVLVASAAGYCFARLTFFGQGVLFALILAALMVLSATMVPLFVMFANWNLLNYPGIILPGLVNAFGVFLDDAILQDAAAEMRGQRSTARASFASSRAFICRWRGGGRHSLFIFMGTWDQLLWPDVAPAPDSARSGGTGVHSPAGAVTSQVMAPSLCR
jgi:multiple sugar transport system permease protein